MNCFCLCPATPPESVKVKGAKGAMYTQIMSYQNQPNTFATSLADVCCAEPLCCIASTCCAPFGCSACYYRKLVLETYHNGIQDFVCFQSVFPRCCCITCEECMPGSSAGLFLEGCCCPLWSLSVARIHLMRTKSIRPDPVDYQIIMCSNALQCISAILDIVAIFIEQAREVAHLIDLLVDLFTYSVAGCMGAQIYHEVVKDKRLLGDGGGSAPTSQVIVRDAPGTSVPVVTGEVVVGVPVTADAPPGAVAPGEVPVGISKD